MLNITHCLQRPWRVAFYFFGLPSDCCKSAGEIFLFHKWHFLKWTLKPFSPLSFLSLFFSLTLPLTRFPPTCFAFLPACSFSPPLSSGKVSNLFFLCVCVFLFIFFSWRRELELRQGAFGPAWVKSSNNSRRVHLSVRLSVRPATKRARLPCCRGDDRDAGGLLMHFFLCSSTRKRQRRLTGYWKDWDPGLNWWVKISILVLLSNLCLVYVKGCQVRWGGACLSGLRLLFIFKVWI